MQNVRIDSLFNDVRENRVVLDIQKETIERLNKEVEVQKAQVLRSMAALTLKTDFENLNKVSEERAAYLVNCCKDLDNKIKTTDRYID